MAKNGFLKDFLFPALKKETFGEKLKWYNQNKYIIALQWMRKNSCWMEDDFIVFTEYDKFRNHYRPCEDKYFSTSKQRFKAALKKHSDEVKILEGLRGYRFFKLNKEAIRLLKRCDIINQAPQEPSHSVSQNFPQQDTLDPIFEERVDLTKFAVMILLVNASSQDSLQDTNTCCPVKPDESTENFNPPFEASQDSLQDTNTSCPVKPDESTENFNPPFEVSPQDTHENDIDTSFLDYWDVNSIHAANDPYPYEGVEDPPSQKPATGDQIGFRNVDMFSNEMGLASGEDSPYLCDNAELYKLLGLDSTDLP